MQVIDLLDVVEALYPTCQLVLEVDQSSNHGAHRSNALNAKTMAGGFGNGSIPHSSKMTEGCLGPDALLKVAATRTPRNIRCPAPRHECSRACTGRRHPVL